MITEQDAKRAAAEGLIPSIECSTEHHKDGIRMSSLELQNAVSGRVFHLGPGLCALCRTYLYGGSESCSFCPLAPGGSTACCSEYTKAVRALESFEKDPSNANHFAFVEAEKVMVKRLAAELAKAKQELTKLDKPKVGDYGIVKNKKGRPPIPKFFFIEGNGKIGYENGGWNSIDTYYTSNYREHIKRGNIFDDLERDSKDLNSFYINEYDCHLGLSASPLSLPICIAGHWHTLNESVEVHQKLGQLIATVKRQSDKMGSGSNDSENKQHKD